MRKLRKFSPTSCGWIFPLLAIALAGCVTTTHIVGQKNGMKSGAQTTVTGGKGYSVDEPVSSEDAVGIDPCEMRLQNIEAAMLLYYSLNRSLPNQLEDLISLSSDDLPLTCPVSNQKYLYFKEGIPIPSSTRRIIICDPTPAHLGKRWCISMAPIIPNAALELEPQKLPESVFRDVQPSH